MLRALRIEQFAIIDALEIELSPGFTVLTGETGAGKSILVDALHLALGGRAQTEVVRTGCEEATVEAVFEASPKVRARLVELGLPDGDELLIRRVVQRSGRSKVWVNGSLCTVTLLEQLAKRLCDIASQHEHVSLLEPGGHLELLDGFGGLLGDRSRYEVAYGELARLCAERQALEQDGAERERRQDYLRFQLEEIDEVAPEPGEDVRLTQERALLASAAKLQGLASAAEEELYSAEGSAAERLSTALARLAELTALDPSLEPLHGRLASARAEVEEGARELSQLGRKLREDPERLLAVDDRLAALRRLSRKHGGDVDALLARRAEMAGELERLTGHAEKRDELALAVEGARAQAAALAQKLSLRRREAAARLSTTLQKELSRLALAKARVEVRFGGDGELGPRGQDEAELFFSANPGEELRPLHRIASGGELSRVMLAFKRAGAGTDPVDIYVFDEVDSGIGGPTAQAVGRMLKEVSRDRQVLCITHLPQIAAFADQHLAVRKLVLRGRTSSEVTPLEDDGERCREIARMLGGDEPTKAALEHAKELIAKSQGAFA
ncbi:MAG: DNA repair protein RecN [Deltaproteobacteria bacterium]